MNQPVILIVEDEPAIAEMYRFKLMQADYKVLVATDGQEGLEACEQHKPDLVLLDIKMPVMTGDEMLTRLRKTDWGANIRVVILTNISRDEAPHTLRVLHVDRYIVKAHHTPAQVLDIVNEILGQ